MKIAETLTDHAVLAELGERLARHRLHQRRTQAQLAEAAGVSKRTIERIEAGHSVQLSSFLRLCRALDLLEGLATLVPVLPMSPMSQLELRGKQRQRVRATQDATTTPATSRDAWTWGNTG
jgi:transcriptional regulator with XRE-family HTH domain